MYCILLYCAQFSSSHCHRNEIDNMDEETIKKIWRQRTAVLSAYPPDEILEICSSVCFLRGLLEKLMEAELTGTGDEDLYWLEILPLALPVCGKPGKRVITTYSLKIWASETGSIFDDDKKLFAGYFLRAFAGVWANRKMGLKKPENIQAQRKHRYLPSEDITTAPKRLGIDKLDMK
ncbi:hypothetical protein B0H13DRAFT_1877615 [Mycena leptocephala]|nr:hypothetical protein B0H13DRAFT_1877615 [Mycena leptocephala]